MGKLPVIYLCENNLYGMGTSIERSAAETRFYARGDYIPGFRFDGMDVLASREAAKFAIEWCRAGKGPLVLEAHTYRYSGHSLSDPGTAYRTREDVRSVRQHRDPIERLKARLIDNDFATIEELKAIEKQIKVDVDAEVEAVKAMPEPPLEELTTHIYKKEPKQPVALVERPAL